MSFYYDKRFNCTGINKNPWFAWFNNIDSQNTKPTWTELKGKSHKSRIIVGEFNISSQVTDRISCKKKNQ